jgi:hypothetical protein
MPRPLAPPSRNDVDPVDQEVYDEALGYWSRMFATDGADLSISPWASAMMHSPRFALQRSELSTLLRTAPDRPGSFSHSDREFVGMVIGTHIKCNIVSAIHAADAVAVGVRPEAIEALYHNRDHDLTEHELALATFIRSVVDGNLTDAGFDDMERRLGTRGVIEYIYYITMIWTTMRQVQAFGAPESSDADVLDNVRRAAEVRAQPAGAVDDSVTA